MALAPKTASLKLVGDWDFSRRGELERMVRSAEAADDVLLDLSEATFIDASVVGTLIGLRKRLTDRNAVGNIRIVAASRLVRLIFEICNLQAAFGLSVNPTGWYDARRI